MAHESFEDADVARAMNAHFVNIKVDREERPDLDQIYQRAYSLLTQQSGGWPLTMFLTPDGTPFFGGTYFPKQSALRPAGLARIAAQGRRGVRHAARSDRRAERATARIAGEARAAGVRCRAAARRAAARVGQARAGASIRCTAASAARRSFRTHPSSVSPAADDAAGDAEARNVLQVTLARMADGGIHDQLGGGFCRYSVDAEWTIPHFEKMLYDNALLLPVYAGYAQAASDRAGARRRARHRRLAGARDARTRRRVLFEPRRRQRGRGRQVLRVGRGRGARAASSDDEWAVVAPHYGLDRPPNFEQHAWNLRVSVPLVDIAARLRIAPSEAAARLASARAKLSPRARTRVRPALDDKILTAWNALAIGGLARASRACGGNAAWSALAFGALDALFATRVARRTPARDTAAWRAQPSTPTSTTTRSCWLRWSSACSSIFARRITRGPAQWPTRCSQHFEDSAGGGFFFVSHDHEALILRHKPGQDATTPSGNGVAALALARFAVIAGEPRYADAARRTLRAVRTDAGARTGRFGHAAARRRRARHAARAGDPRRRCRGNRRRGAKRSRALTPTRSSSTSPATTTCPPRWSRARACAMRAAAHVCRDYTLPAAHRHARRAVRHAVGMSAACWQGSCRSGKISESVRFTAFDRGMQ